MNLKTIYLILSKSQTECLLLTKLKLLKTSWNINIRWKKFTLTKKLKWFKAKYDKNLIKMTKWHNKMTKKPKLEQNWKYKNKS